MRLFGRKVRVQRLVDELEGIAYARANDFVEVTDAGARLREPAAGGRWAAVQQLKVGAHGVELRFYNKEWALEKLMEIYERQRGSGADNGPIKALLQGLREDVAKVLEEREEGGGV